MEPEIELHGDMDTVLQADTVALALDDDKELREGKTLSDVVKEDDGDRLFDVDADTLMLADALRRPVSVTVAEMQLVTLGDCVVVAHADIDSVTLALEERLLEGDGTAE